MENGGGSQSTLLIVVALGCACLVCAAGLYWAYQQGWLDSVFKPAEDDNADPGTTGTETTEVVTPPEEGPVDEGPVDEGPGDEGPGDEGPVDEEEEEEDEDPRTDPPNDPPAGKHVCKEPWNRKVVKYDSNNQNPRCCTNGSQSYNDCKEGEALAVSSDFDVEGLYNKTNQELSGRVQGALAREKCWAPIGPRNSSNVTSIVYFERDKKGQGDTVAAWCHPVAGHKDGAFKAGQAFAIYPACYENGSLTKTIKTDRWGSGCYTPGDINSGTGKGDESKKKGELRWSKTKP